MFAGISGLASSEQDPFSYEDTTASSGNDQCSEVSDTEVESSADERLAPCTSLLTHTSTIPYEAQFRAVDDAVKVLDQEWESLCCLLYTSPSPRD